MYKKVGLAGDKRGRPKMSGPKPKIISIGKDKISEPQQQGVINLLSGDFDNPQKALKAAGYTNKMGYKRFIKQKGVQNFLKFLDAKSIKLYGTSVIEKVMSVYTEALAADKIVGRLDQVVPDHKIRIEVATKIAEIMNIKPVAQVAPPTGPTTNIQYNYFSTDRSKQKAFNEKFLGFVSEFREDESVDPHASSESLKESNSIEEAEEV